MNSFEFRTVPTIRVEWGGASRLGEILKAEFDARRVLIVTDAGLVEAGLIDAPRTSLEAEGHAVSIFSGVVADPPERVLDAAVALARDSRVDLVIGLGGGSSLDVAKLTALLARSPQPLEGLYGIGKAVGPRLALVQVPTTAGTGSEVTDITILTTGETTKMGVVSRQLFADLVLLDAQLSVGLPAIHTAATGIDAMVHAIEAYTSRHRKNPLSDMLAREALRLLGDNLVAVCSNGADRPAREAMLLGATLAGQAFANAPVAAVHALAYPLGGRHHIAHGLSNALMLGPVLRFNASAAARHYGELGTVLTGKADAGAFVAEMERLCRESGAPMRLRDVGIGEEDLEILAADAMKQTRLLVNNPVEIGEAEALALYRKAF